MESALRGHPSVAECVVLTRTTRAGDAACVAFVVPYGSCASADIVAHVQATRPAPVLHVVQVSALPLLETGAIDEETLRSLPIVDAEAVGRCRVRAADLGADSSIAISEAPQHRRSLHVSRLLLDPVEGLERDPIPAAPGSVGPVIVPLEPASVPAFADGGALPILPGSPETLPDALERAALTFGSHTITFIESDLSEHTQTYEELFESARCVAGGLQALKVQHGSKVLLQIDRVRDFITAFWGCVFAGAVPVPVTMAMVYDRSNSNAAKLRHAWQLLDDPLVLTSRAHAPAVQEFFLSERLAGVKVAAIEDVSAREPASSRRHSDPQDVAVIMLTSGSTGAPKCVTLTHANLLAMTAGVQIRNDFSERDVTLNWMAMDHVAGIVMSHVRDVYLGCRQVHAPTDLVLQRPTRWLDWIDRFRVTITFAPNFAYGLVAKCADEVTAGSWDLSSVRSILNGGEAVVAATARRFLSLLARHRLGPRTMVPAWGMSETSSGVTFSDAFSLDSTSDQDAFVEVGAPIPGCALRIVDDQNCVVGEGTSGRLQAKGASVTRGYYERPDLNAEMFTRDGWFTTGDLAIIRNGRLAITGRAKDDVVINGVKYYSPEIESVVDELTGVSASYTAACGVRRAGADTEDLAIFFVPDSRGGESVATLMKLIRHQVAERIGASPRYVLAVERDDIPKTAIGKIQRALLRQRFEQGDFDVRVVEHDILSENASTLPDWFFRSSWRRKQPTRSIPPASALVFSDASGLGDSLCATLERRGTSIVVVEPGESFTRLGASRYRVNPVSREDVDHLFASLAADGIEPRHIVHAWTFDRPGSDGRRELTGVLCLLQALAGVAAAPRQLTVVSSHARSIDERDQVDLYRSAIGGLLRTAEEEIPSLRVRQVDLPGLDVAAESLLVADELECADRDRDVAYRNGVRWVTCLERLDLSGSDKQPLPFKTGGMYLLTGGLGGVGVEIANLLLKRFGARLLIVGRTPVDASPDAVSASAPDRLAALQTLRATAASSSGDVRYEAADVTDLARMREVVDEAAAHWGCRLDGIVHLAGVFKDRLVIEETPESLAETLAPKLEGTRVLDQILDAQGGQLFISFGSVTAYLGRLGGGAYAAANALLESIALSQRRRGVRAYCLSWSAWDNLGMIRGYSTASGGAKGYYALTRTQGLNSFLAALHSVEPVVLIGVDARAPDVRRLVHAECRAIERLVVSVPADAGVPSELSLEDGFGGAVACAVVRAHSPDGVVSSTAPHETARPPQTELERTIAQVWQEVLNIAEPDVDSTFFDLGGSSVLIARVYVQLRERMRGELSMTEMFRYPTIAALAGHLSGRSSSESEEIGRDRGRGIDRRAKVLRARRPATIS